MEEEHNQGVNGGDSDDDGEDARYFYYSMRKVKMVRTRVFLDDYWIEKSDEGQMNSVLVHVRYTMYPDEFKVSKAPYDWVDPAPNT